MSNTMQHKTAFKATFTSLALIILLGSVDLCNASKRVLTEVSNTESSAEDFVYGLLKDQDIVVFSKSYCPYCRRAKATLNELLGNHESIVEMTIVELDLIDANYADSIKEVLVDLTSQYTVPNIFIEAIHVGGNDDLQESVERGEVQHLIRNVIEERLMDAEYL